MRILALTDSEIFPPCNGETIPIAAHLRALSELGSLDLACIGFRPERPHALPANTRCFTVECEPIRSKAGKLWSNLRGHVPGRVPANPLELCSRLSGRDYDLVYMGQMRLMDWGRAAKQCLETPAMMVNLCDSLVETRLRMKQLAGVSGFEPSFRAYSWVRSFQAATARRWEREAVELFDRVLVQSENDRITVARSAGPGLADRVVVAPNGIRDDAFQYNYRGQHNQRLLHLGGIAGERFQLVLWFIRKVFLPLLKSHPRARLDLVGSVSSKHKALLDQFPNVTCHGFADDLQTCVEQSTISIAPMMMRFGVINKAAESMAAGLPVMGLGAFSGFPNFVPGKHAVEVHSADEWVAALQNLLDAPEELGRLSQAGRDFASQMRWDGTLAKVQQAAVSAVEGAARPQVTRAA